MNEFDPAGHTVAQVREHLAGADDGERERVLAAERAGKARASLLGAGEEREPSVGAEPSEAGQFVDEDGRFDANAAAEAAIDELVGDRPVLPRRRAYATVLHTEETAAAGRPLPVGERARAALRLGEP